LLLGQRDRVFLTLPWEKNVHDTEVRPHDYQAGYIARLDFLHRLLTRLGADLPRFRILTTEIQGLPATFPAGIANEGLVAQDVRELSEQLLVAEEQLLPLRDAEFLDDRVWVDALLRVALVGDLDHDFYSSDFFSARGAAFFKKVDGTQRVVFYDVDDSWFVNPWVFLNDIEESYPDMSTEELMGFLFESFLYRYVRLPLYRKHPDCRTSLRCDQLVVEAVAEVLQQKDEVLSWVSTQIAAENERWSPPSQLDYGAVLERILRTTYAKLEGQSYFAWRFVKPDQSTAVYATADATAAIRSLYVWQPVWPLGSNTVNGRIEVRLFGASAAVWVDESALTPRVAF